MPSAGAVCPPTITAIRQHIYGQSTTHIDTSVLIEITCGKIKDFFKEMCAEIQQHSGEIVF